MCDRRRGKPAGVEPVVDQIDLTVRAGEAAQMAGVDLRARGHPGAGGELFALLPFGRRPDVLGVGRTAPGQAAQDGGVHRHRGRRVQEVRVQLDDVARQFGRQHERLPQAANPRPGRVAPEVAPPHGERYRVPGKTSGHAPCAPDAHRLVMQVLGQVEDRRAYRRVDRMGLPVRGVAQREQRQGDPARLEGVQFLRNEGFRQARITLEDHCDDAGRERTIHPVSVA